MPTYEYKCTKCKKKFDQLQRMSDKPLKRCIRCGGKVDRQFSAGAGLIFKGTGFYQTDYKKSSSTDSSKPKDKSEKKASDTLAMKKAE